MQSSGSADLHKLYVPVLQEAVATFYTARLACQQARQSDSIGLVCRFNFVFFTSPLSGGGGHSALSSAAASC